MDKSPTAFDAIELDIENFNKTWTAQGIPDSPAARLQLGFAIKRLIHLGAARDVLLRYVVGVMNSIADDKPAVVQVNEIMKAIGGSEAIRS